MRQFDLNNKVNPEKVFILQSSEIEKRLDPFYYVPSIRRLEEQVKKHKPEPLRKHILSVSSGATPKTTEKEKYYSDKENGIPFLRVQNLSPTGILDIENCKYINRETHEKYLKRSQVEGGDLLVKITGVGRMAIASIAHDGFIGNTNQHMVVIKTGSKEKSELLAAYLNTDIAERLASRRATGGTRPALDYPALLSIPIILDEKILEIRNRAIEIKQIKEQEANKLLNSVDDYLLNELGIIIPQKDNSLKNRIFKVNYSEVSGIRIDPVFYDNHTKALRKAVNSNLYKNYRLKNLVVSTSSGDWGLDPRKEKVGYTKCLVIRATEFDNIFNLKLDNSRVKYRLIEDVKLKKISLNENDLLIEKSGGSPNQPVGRVAIIRKELIDQNQLCFSNFIYKISINENLVLPEYLFAFLKTMHNIKITESMQSQTNGIRNLIMSNYLDQTIVLPIKNGKIDLEKQKEITDKIIEIKDKALTKLKEAKDALKLSKEEIEHLVLGEL